jgi:branched-chain amino acid transport system substrate-binding protein
MPKIGVLLPGSTLYPSIGIDFLQGLRSCFNFYNHSEIEVIVHPVGYGIKEKDIYAQTEKWLLSESTDVVILFAEDRFANILSPLFTATGKLLLITNAGAHYPFVKAVITNTLFHSLNDCFHSYLTGKLCADASGPEKSAIFATSFYDGGYQHCHAMTNALTRAGGDVKYNFIAPAQREGFDITPLMEFVEKNPAVNNILCIYSGDMARLFYNQINTVQHSSPVRLYGSPMMFDRTPGDFREVPSKTETSGYCAWSPTLDNPENNQFAAYFLVNNNKPVNLFSFQGWEVGLLVIAYLGHRSATASVSVALERFRLNPVLSPRGVLRLNNNSTIVAPAYLVNASGEMSVTVQDVMEDTSAEYQEMIDQIPDTGFSTWQNTYLCI